MRTFFASFLAFLLIMFGFVIIGMAAIRLAQESGFMRRESGTDSAALLDVQMAVAQTPQPMLAGVESGGMALASSSPPSAPELAAPGLTQKGGGALLDVPVEPTLPSPPTATVDPCAAQPEPGFAAESTVVAVGMIRLYTDTDVLAATLGEFGAGQNFVVTSDAAGVTAIRRCELVWVRVRLVGGQQGWVLAHAVEIGLPAPAPTTIMPPVVAPICPGGCATPVCVQPCYNQCAQPCANPCQPPCTQPCTTPCGVYTQ